MSNFTQGFGSPHVPGVSGDICVCGYSFTLSFEQTPAPPIVLGLMWVLHTPLRCLNLAPCALMLITLGTLSLVILCMLSELPWSLLYNYIFLGEHVCGSKYECLTALGIQPLVDTMCSALHGKA